jgi:hypothetical protein
MNNFVKHFSWFSTSHNLALNSRDGLERAVVLNSGIMVLILLPVLCVIYTFKKYFKEKKIGVWIRFFPYAICFMAEGVFLILLAKRSVHGFGIIIEPLACLSASIVVFTSVMSVLGISFPFKKIDAWKPITISYFFIQVILTLFLIFND